MGVGKCKAEKRQEEGDEKKIIRGTISSRCLSGSAIPGTSKKKNKEDIEWQQSQNPTIRRVQAQGKAWVVIGKKDSWVGRNVDRN